VYNALNPGAVKTAPYFWVLPATMPIRILIVFLSFTFVLSFSSQVFSQQADKDLYVGLYRQGEYQEVVTVLKRLTKQNPSDGNAMYYLGLSYLKIGQDKEAVKVLEKAVSLDSNNAQTRTALAYAYLSRNDPRSSNQAYEAVKLDPKIPEGHYILSVNSLRDGSYNAAYERAKKAIELNPDFAMAYLVKSQALVSSFAQQTGTIVRPASSKGEFLSEAVADLEKYLSLAPKSSNTDYYERYLESIRFFAKYYSQPENQKTTLSDENSPSDKRTTPLKLISKPRANYTDRARDAGVSGVVRLLIGLGADGTIKHILVLKTLGYGLDENAVAAARQIKFQPKTVDGKPMPSVITMEYTFTIY
jgi:TonB family protein